MTSRVLAAPKRSKSSELEVGLVCLQCTSACVCMCVHYMCACTSFFYDCLYKLHAVLECLHLLSV